MTTGVPPLVFAAKVDAAYAIFKSILGLATPHEIFRKRKFAISDDGRRLYEFRGNDAELAEAVLGADFPREVGPIDLDHFTSFAVFKAIVTTQQLHLSRVAKHLAADEFSTFAREHRLDGYFANTAPGRKVYEELSADLFFISMTKPDNPDEATLWDVFADQGRGVRLRLRVTCKPAADLRRMGYQNRPTAFKRINDELLAKEGLVYTPWGISRICAFYLPLGYGHEREVRLLIKRHVGGVSMAVIGGGGDEVWPVPLATPGGATGDPWCEISLIEVRPGPRCSLGAVQAVLAGSPYAGVPVRTS